MLDDLDLHSPCQFHLNLNLHLNFSIFLNPALNLFLFLVNGDDNTIGLQPPAACCRR